MPGQDSAGTTGGGDTTPQRRRGTALVDAIHAATLAELAEVGLEGLTMEGVAARAGAGKASLYKRWADTGDLVLSALTAADQSFDAERERMATMTPFDLRDALVEVLALFADGLDTPLGATLHMLMARRASHPALVRRVREAMVAPRAAVLRTVLDRAVAEGTIETRALTPLVQSTGPRLVIAQHKELGRVSRSDVEDIVDQVLLPALRRRPFHLPRPAADPAHDQHR